MFGIGFGELLVLLAVGIIVLGPERCVRTSKKLGAVVRKLQTEWNAVHEDLSDNNE